MEKKELIKYAIKAQERANAKFSNYKVGAALLLDSVANVPHPPGLNEGFGSQWCSFHSSI